MSNKNLCEEAWLEELYRKYHNEVIRMLTFALRGDLQAAEEIYQDTMMTAWSKCQSMPGGPKLKVWVFKTAKNKMLNHIREKVRSSEKHKKFEAQSPDEDVPGADSWIDEPVEIGPIATLSLTDRRILILVLGYEFSCKEAAEILAIEPAAARQRLKRARANARNLTFDQTGPVPPRQRQGMNGGDLGVSATQGESPRKGA